MRLTVPGCTRGRQKCLHRPTLAPPSPPRREPCASSSPTLPSKPSGMPSPTGLGPSPQLGRLCRARAASALPPVASGRAEDVAAVREGWRGARLVRELPHGQLPARSGWRARAGRQLRHCQRLHRGAASRPGLCHAADGPGGRGARARFAAGPERPALLGRGRSALPALGLPGGSRLGLAHGPRAGRALRARGPAALRGGVLRSAGSDAPPRCALLLLAERSSTRLVHRTRAHLLAAAVPPASRGPGRHARSLHRPLVRGGS